MANNDFDKTRNDYQQYDLVTVFKASESRVLRHLHVATMAVVTKVDGDTVQCMPFPIREGTTANNIYAYNIGKSEFKEGDKVLVIFTDRDFRKNYDSATTNERSIGTTNDAKLHSIDYGVVIPIAKQYEGSIEALREKVDNHISNSNNPHKVTKEQVNLGNVVNQGMDTTPTKGSGKYVTSGGVYNSIESVKSDLNATNEVVNQFEANYATKDYVVGNFANKYDTNKAIEAVSTKASNNETEISSIKENYVTKASADETYAKATETNTKLSEIDTKISDTNTKISDTNTNLSKTDAKVSTIEKNITDINTSLGTKQDKLSFGNGLSNTNNLIAVDFTKVQAKLSVGSGILFSNDTLSINTSVIPTIEYLEAQGYAKATDVTKNAEAIAEIKNDYAKSSSIGNGKVVIKQNGTEKGSFTMNQGEATEINLTDTDTHVAVVNNLTSSSTTSALSAYQGNVLNGKISDTNKAVAGKQDAFTVGEGLTYASGVLAVDTSKFVGYTDYTEKMSSIDEKIATNAGSISTLNTDVSSLKTSTADNKKSIDTINKNLSSLYGRVDTNEKSISIINGNVSSLDTRVTTNENSISAINTNVSTLSKNVEDVTAKANASASSISSLDSRVTTNSEDIKTNKASITALSYKYGNGKAIARTAFDDTNTLAKEVFGDNYVDHSNLVVVRSTDPYNGDYFAQSWSSGLFWNQGDSWAGFTVGGRDYGKDVKFVVGGVGNKGNPLWTFDLITTLNIASQTVKSFTATEVNHGCKFNGDLQSTSLTYSPRITSYNEIETAVDNSPKTAKTTKTRNVWFGNVEKEVTAPMNPFIEYFFDHGYHFNNFSSSTSDPDNVHDIGLVVWNRLLYFCTFTYTGTKKEFIVRPVTLGTAISTESLDDTSQPVVFEDTSTQSAQIDTKSVNIDVSPTYDEIEAKGSLYEWFGDKKDRVYNVFLRVDGRPPIRMDFDEEKSDFITADGKSCLDYPDMKGVLYETY